MTDDRNNRTDPAGQAGPAGEEQALRSLLAGAVQGLEPAEGALERLRHAVPARRARKRQALVAAAAAALLAGTAIPAALHLGGEQGTTTDRPAMAGHGEAQKGKSGDPSEPRHNGAGAGAQPESTRSVGQAPQDGTGDRPAPQAGGSPSGGVTAGPDGTGATAGATTGTGPGPAQQPPVAAPGAPACTGEQLGVRGSARAPESDGKVYGSFQVTNVSARGCTVTGPDTVTAASLATTPPAQGPAVAVTSHTEGDPASGLLPDPSAETPMVVLQPNAAYEVRFAWVPSAQSCPAATPGPSAKPAEQGGPAQAPAGAADQERAAAGTDAAVDPLSGTTAPDPAGVEVSHTPGTPVAGAPVTQTTIPAACGGTVYRTGIIPQAAP
ncbi:hypothetical protein ABZZ17_06990 [Streptomyces sp. NPDC006512]|uniref:hypothetical protein n=1 Tax=Streptomyces sp. NPDC006512 TaxID=3154307 RepID=UPI0033B6F576